MLYKLVCLPDGREIPVPESHSWMAMDKDGYWYTHESEPKLLWCSQVWLGDGGRYHLVPYINGPFKPGDWTTQLYEI